MGNALVEVVKQDSLRQIGSVLRTEGDDSISKVLSGSRHKKVKKST